MKPIFRTMRLDAAGWQRRLLATTAVSERFDANETMSFSRQLEAIDDRLYRVVYPELLATKLVPVIPGIPVGAEEYTYRAVTELGRARVTANLAGDHPRVDVVGTETTSPIVNVTASYGFSVQDLERSALTRIPLDAERALTVRNAIAVQVNNLILLGDSAVGVSGLYKDSGVQIVAVATGTWSSATAEQMLGDLQKLERTIITDAKGMEKPDMLVLPPSLFGRVSTAKLPYSDETALSFFLRTSQSVKGVEIDALLETAGVSSVARIVMYTRDPMKVGAVLPLEFGQESPQPKGFEFIVPCRARCGGAVVRYPGSAGYMDGC